MSPRSRLTLLISAGAVAAYFSLRALPDTACGFLHLHEGEVSADGLEYCSPKEVAMFADPEAIRFPVTAFVEAVIPPVAGVTSRMRLKLVGPGGKTVAPHEIAISHTRSVHLLVADPTLDDYRHLHPEPAGAQGWEFDFTPVSGGDHVLFIDCVHAFTRRRQVMRVVVAVAGTAGVPAPDRGMSAVCEDGLRVELSSIPSDPVAGEDVDLLLSFSARPGCAVALNPVMASYAHLVAFARDRASFAHLHPMQTGRERDVSPQLRFRLRADKPGRYRLWAQFDTGSGERFVPFDLMVK